MMLAKSALKGISQRIRVLDDKKLEELLKIEQAKLKNLQKTQNGENFEYLSTSINQKIALIKQEMNHREDLNILNK